MITKKQKQAKRFTLRTLLLVCFLSTLVFSFSAYFPSFAETVSRWNPKNYHYFHTPEIAVKRKGRSTFYRDPFVWVYTSSFAKRYGMPKEWVDDSLKGAEAIAFRHMPSNAVQCGFFRNKNACRVDISCRLDLYVPKSANLPWVDDRKQGFQARSAFRSMRYLVKQKEEEMRQYDPTMLPDPALPKNFNPYGGRVGIQSVGIAIYKPENVPLALGRRPQKIGGNYGNGNAFVQEFDRSFLSEIDYISTRIACSHPAAEKGIPVISIDDFIIKDGKRLSNFPHPEVHQIIIPRSYWNRVNQFHQENYRKKDSFSQFVIDRLKGKSR